MLFLTVLILCLLVAVNYRLGGRSFLYPPIIFCGAWTVNLVQLWLLEDLFYPLSTQTLFVILVGAFAVSAGSWLALFCPQRQVSEPGFSEQSNRLLNLLLWVVIVGFPLYIRWVISLVRESGVATFLGAVRSATVGDSTRGLGYSFFFNLVTLSVFVALLAFYEMDHHRLRSMLAIVLAVIMNVLTGAKAGGIILLLTLVFLSWMRKQRFPWKFAAVTLLLVVLMFGFIQFYVQLGGKAEGSTGELIGHLALYTSGPIIAYDRMVREPHLVPDTYPLYLPFVHLLEKFGAVRTENWSDASGYVQVGPGLVTNAAGMFASYRSVGMPGMICGTALVGFTVTLVYKRAMQGNRMWRVLYASLASGLLLSAQGEYFFTSLNFLAKLIAVVWFVYYFPAVWNGFARLMGRGVQSQIARWQHPSS